MDNILPFTAIVGMDLVKKSLLYHAVDPRLGGLLLMGHRGCAKSTLARSFKDILSVSENYEIPFVEVPLGTTEDRLLGSIDASRLLKNGEWSTKIGLIQKANEGVLYIDEINLLPDNLVDSILDSSTSGQHHIEREGISQTVRARYILIGSMNPEEGDLRPQLTDRFTHGIIVRDEFSVEQRKEIVRIRMDFDDDPTLFVAKHNKKLDLLKKQIVEARLNLKKVEISENLRNEVAEKASLLNLEGVRAELGVLRTVRCAAAWRGRKIVSEEDVKEAWVLCLGHRIENFTSRTQNSKPEKKLLEKLADKKDSSHLLNQKTSMSPMGSLEDEITLDTTEDLSQLELFPWWNGNKKISKIGSHFMSRTSTLTSKRVPTSRISWYYSLHASLKRGWSPGMPWLLRYSKPSRRSNFWIFLDASRSSGAINFLSGALDAIQNLGSKTFRSRFHVLVLQKGKLNWSIKRGTFKSFREFLNKLNEASGKSDLVLALDKFNVAIKKHGFLNGDRVLLCSDGMFNFEKGKSLFERKNNFRNVLRKLSRSVCDLGWLHPKLQRGMQHWLPDLSKGSDVRLITLRNGNRGK